MSATTLGHNGVEAVKRKEYGEAIQFLDKALESSESPVWLLARSEAHQNLKNFEAALRDAELAYNVAAQRGSGNSRKQMIEAQYRRSVQYHRLGRYADADCCAKWSMSLAEGRPAREDDGVEKKVDENGNYTVTYEDGVADNKGQPGENVDKSAGIEQRLTQASVKTGFEDDWRRAYIWRSQVLGMMKNLPEDHPGRKVSVTKVPPKPQKDAEKATPKVAEESRTSLAKPTEPQTGMDAETAAQAEIPRPDPVSGFDTQLQLRTAFYQSNQTVTLTLFSKGIKREALDVKMSKNKIQIAPLPRPNAPWAKPGEPEATSTLFLDGEIDPSKSRWTATPLKIELVLHKAAPGVKWGTWGKEWIGAASAETAVPSAETTPATSAASPPDAGPAAAPIAPPPASAAAPAYPTSSRHGPKDWEKLGQEEAEDDQNDVNFFFKQLYKGATPEQQRAMMKSFIESNGTALSTDWEDVKSRKVETVPPQGVEAKKWDS
ncbi:SGS-domain-containing protein [Parathielavia appendiculata]|uniref:SGS-domain-containing protein n=1 Tax=Parathielavia appendiculata TaxID=2587402 RepID=A0AAN6Z2Z0_9PEZI|nr:SGS-domain-containing protein [Parathielavia appendiculata]